jgi:hypothetical protein
LRGLKLTAEATSLLDFLLKMPGQREAVVPANVRPRWRISSATAGPAWRASPNLPVPPAFRRSRLYFHVVFTLPRPIADIAYQNKAVVYDRLLKTAAETLITIAAEPRQLNEGGGSMGRIMGSIQPWRPLQQARFRRLDSGSSVGVMMA